MKLLGERNWWAPRPLARLHARLRLGEGDSGRWSEQQQGVERRPSSVAAARRRPSSRSPSAKRTTASTAPASGRATVTMNWNSSAQAIEHRPAGLQMQRPGTVDRRCPGRPSGPCAMRETPAKRCKVRTGFGARRRWATSVAAVDAVRPRVGAAERSVSRRCRPTRWPSTPSTSRREYRCRSGPHARRTGARRRGNRHPRRSRRGTAAVTAAVAAAARSLDPQEQAPARRSTRSEERTASRRCGCPRADASGEVDELRDGRPTTRSTTSTVAAATSTGASGVRLQERRWRRTSRRRGPGGRRVRAVQALAVCIAANAAREAQDHRDRAPTAPTRWFGWYWTATFGAARATATVAC